MRQTKIKNDISGILLLNKPHDITSNLALQKAKGLYQAAKAGHTGSLDPLATGMLPICFGQATKFSQYLLDADKTYEAVGLLGVKTSTADAQGEVLETVSNVDVKRETLEAVLAKFKGKILQVPSMYSALKHQGRPLYTYARKGIEIERAAREVEIKHLSLLAYDGRSFEIKVTCSKGTYIRNLVEDIGEALGVYAHVTKLHRVETAGLGEYPMYSLEALQALDFDAKCQILLPTQVAVSHLNKLYLDASQVQTLRFGQTVNLAQQDEDLIQLYDETEKFIGLGQLKASILRVVRLVSGA